MLPFRGTVAASAGLAVDHGDANVLFGGIVGGLDVRTVEEHRRGCPDSVADASSRIAWLAGSVNRPCSRRFKLRLEESLGNAQAMRADLDSIAPIAARQVRACRRMALTKRGASAFAPRVAVVQ